MKNTGDAREQLRLSCVAATERLVDELARRGFIEQKNVRPPKWRGLMQADSHHTVIDITVPMDYPYSAPSVTPLTRAAAEAVLGRSVASYREVSNSWHLEHGGRMCLFEAEDHTLLPWAAPETLFEQIREWLVQDATGWPDDHPALDLERYLNYGEGVLLFDSLDNATGKVVRLTGRGSRLAIHHPAKVPRGPRGNRRRWTAAVALVLDIGEVTAPIRDWDALVAAAGTNAARLISEVDNGVRTLVLRYARGTAQGVLAVRLAASGDSWTVTALRSAPQDLGTLRRRAHPDLGVLVKARVVVVGVGAIGSVLADLLHRSGIGTIDLYDADIVEPGNLVRHLVDGSHSLENKAKAVAATLRAARPESPTKITAHDIHVTTLDKAFAVLEQFDLVVDATADSTASPMLAAAARAGGGQLVSVAVLADGYAVRVDHYPGKEHEVIDLPAPRPGVYETGCSSPVSTTPPAAAWEAAALGARHAIDVLLGLSPSGETRILQLATIS